MAALTSLPRKARTALSMGSLRRRLLVEAARSLYTARTRIRRLPFAQVAEQLGQLLPDALPDQAPSFALDQSDVAREIGWAVRTVARLVPFRALCLEQAIAAQAMLKRRGVGSVLYLGVQAAPASPMSAHAWLSAAGVRVTGYPVGPHLRTVGRFVCDGR